MLLEAVQPPAAACARKCTCCATGVGGMQAQLHRLAASAGIVTHQVVALLHHDMLLTRLLQETSLDKRCPEPASACLPLPPRSPSARRCPWPPSPPHSNATPINPLDHIPITRSSATPPPPPGQALVPNPMETMVQLGLLLHDQPECQCSEAPVKRQRWLHWQSADMAPRLRS
jgi:hypothetical protein